MSGSTSDVHVDILIFYRFGKGSTGGSRRIFFQSNDGFELSDYVSFVFQLVLPLVVWLLDGDLTQ